MEEKERVHLRGAVHGGWKELVGNSEKREHVVPNLGPKVSGHYSAHK